MEMVALGCSLRWQEVLTDSSLDEWYPPEWLSVCSVESIHFKRVWGLLNPATQKQCYVVREHSQAQLAELAVDAAGGQLASEPALVLAEQRLNLPALAVLLLWEPVRHPPSPVALRPLPRRSASPWRDDALAAHLLAHQQVRPLAKVCLTWPQRRPK